MNLTFREVEYRAGDGVLSVVAIGRRQSMTVVRQVVNVDNARILTATIDLSQMLVALVTNATRV